MSDFQLNDTIVALATAAGKSGICVVRLSGAEAITFASRLLQKPEKLFTALPNSSFHSELFSADRELIDDGVLTVYRALHSFTGEDVVEIAGHGSLAIAEVLVSELTAIGARLAEPGEFSRRAFYNGKLQLQDLEIINSRVDASDRNSLRGSARGIKDKFERLEELYRSLIALLAEVNADIDFGESDSIQISGLNEKIKQARASVTSLLEVSRTKAANARAYTVALTGPPNVGKSSLFNALIAYRRSIVSETPGTTRDYLEAYIDLQGHRIKLVDTAGERVAGGEIEREGIALGRTAALEADLVFLLTDPTDRHPEIPNGVILVHNKSDLDSFQGAISISALTGEGLGALREQILRGAKGLDVELSKPVLSLSERSTLELIESKLAALINATPTDPGLLADDLRATLEAVAPLLGLNISEDALNHIFASMCIGK